MLKKTLRRRFLKNLTQKTRYQIKIKKSRMTVLLFCFRRPIENIAFGQPFEIAIMPKIKWVNRNSSNRLKLVELVEIYMEYIVFWLLVHMKGVLTSYRLIRRHASRLRILLVAVFWWRLGSCANKTFRIDEPHQDHRV